MQLPLALALLGASSLVLAEKRTFLQPSSNINGNSLLRRQSGAFTSNPVYGDGETCQESFGPDSRECPSTKNDPWCYQPSEGHTCCSEGCELFLSSLPHVVPSTPPPYSPPISPLPSSSYREANKCTDGCPAESFCLTNQQCCPNGLDPAECAAERGITLPADFKTESAVNTNPTASATASASDATTSAGSSLPPIDDDSHGSYSNSTGHEQGYGKDHKATGTAAAGYGKGGSPTASSGLALFTGAGVALDVSGAAVAACAGLLSAVLGVAGFL